MRIHRITITAGILVTGVLFLASGCTNPNDPTGSASGPGAPVDGSPAIRVSAREGDVEVGGKVFFEDLSSVDSVSTETITIHNDGDGTLVISDISLLSYGQGPPPDQDQKDVTLDDDPDPGVFYWVSLPSTAPLGPGMSRDVQVRVEYKPGVSFLEARITIASNDGTHPSREVVLEVFVQDVSGGPGTEI